MQVLYTAATTEVLRLIARVSGSTSHSPRGSRACGWPGRVNACWQGVSVWWWLA